MSSKIMRPRRLLEAIAAGLILWGLASPAPAQAPVIPGTNTCVAKGVGCNFLPYGVTNPLAMSPVVAGAIVSSANPLPVTSAAPAAGTAGAGYPPGAIAITASATGTTAATTATLAASVGKFTYICTFDIGSTATAAAAGNATVTGTVTGTLNYEMGTGASPAVVHTTIAYNPCVQGSAVNTAIAVVSAAPGTGGVISVTATGYQQ